MADRLNVLVICGSLRKASLNAALARSLPALAPAELSLVDAPPHDGFPHYNHDLSPTPEVHAFADAIRASDGVIFVAPEYNWTIPGPLKNAVDWVSRFTEQPFKGKAVAIQSASASPIGGVRMQNHLRQCLVSLDAIAFGRPEVLVTNAKDKFDPSTLALTDATGGIL